MTIINHREAEECAHAHINDSNLARCYLDLLRRVRDCVIDVPAVSTIEKEVSIDVLNLTAHSTHPLMRAGIHTLRELVANTEHRMLRIPGVGHVTVEKVKTELAKLGLYLGMPNYNNTTARERVTERDAKG